MNGWLDRMKAIHPSRLEIMKVIHQEALELLECGAAFTFSNQDEFNTCMNRMQQNMHSSGGAHYVIQNAGATSKILNIALSKN